MPSKKIFPEVSLITPMFNEAMEIKGNICRIIEVMEKWEEDWEYILVDDGSTDASYQIACDLLDSHPNCRVIHYPVNRGRGYALRQGIEEARGRYVVTTESDLSWGPEIIRNLYETLISSASDVVVASVFHEKGGFRNVPLFRRLLSAWGNQVMRLCFESDITQFSGMTRGYRREAIQSLHLEENDKEVHLEIIGKAEALGLSISEVPAKMQWSENRAEGGVKRKLSVLRYVIPHLLNSLNQGSLKIFFALSFVLFFLGFGLSAFGTINKFYFITADPKTNMVNYGLILILTSIVCAFFTGISLQLAYLRKSLVQVQSQVKGLTIIQSQDLEKEEQ